MAAQTLPIVHVDRNTPQASAQDFSYNIKAHPTVYAGVEFRSRLEATWAAFFDLCKWDWQYEPVDLVGWSPDFLLSTDWGDQFVEVKPYEFTRDIGDKMRAAAPGCYLLFLPLAPRKSDIFITDSPCKMPDIWILGKEYSGGCWDSWCAFPYHGDIWQTWCAASNITRWKGPSK